MKKTTFLFLLLSSSLASADCGSRQLINSSAHVTIVYQQTVFCYGNIIVSETPLPVPKLPLETSEPVAETPLSLPHHPDARASCTPGKRIWFYSPAQKRHLYYTRHCPK